MLSRVLMVFNIVATVYFAGLTIERRNTVWLGWTLLGVSNLVDCHRTRQRERAELP